MANSILSEHWEAITRYSQITDTMGRQVFDRIKWFLHFCDNNKAKKLKEQGNKIKPLLSGYLHLNIHEVTPKEHHLTDDQMIHSKGRSALQQYLPKKPTKWEIQVFIKVGLSGLIHNFEVY